MTETDEEFNARMKSQDNLVIRVHPTDGALLVNVEGRARCVECGEWLLEGWSYMKKPFDGNYVECDGCRYGVKGGHVRTSSPKQRV